MKITKIGVPAEMRRDAPRVNADLLKQIANNNAMPSTVANGHSIDLKPVCTYISPILGKSSINKLDHFL